MTGIEKIIAQIEEESGKRRDAVMLTAKEEAKGLVADAKRRAGEESDRIMNDARDEAERIIAGAKASADALTRTKFLEVRNAVVNDVIAAAFEEITKLDDKAYFDLLFDMLKRHIEPGQCEMVLGRRDLERLPADFEDTINGEVYEIAAVSISKTPGELESGFILVYPEYEINCSIKSLIEEHMDEIKDKLSETLFD